MHDRSQSETVVKWHRLPNRPDYFVADHGDRRATVSGSYGVYSWRVFVPLGETIASGHAYKQSVAKARAIEALAL